MNDIIKNQDFIFSAATSNITKQVLAHIITDVIINKKFINRCGLFRYNTIDVVVPLMKTAILITFNKTEKTTNAMINVIGCLQNRAPSLNETDINTLCSSQQLAPETTTDTTLLNTTAETSPTVPTDI